jgi:hypothetical protein
MFGRKPQQQQQLVVEKGQITPEEKQMFKELYYNSSEAYSRTFLPLTLINRPQVIFHLQKVKEGTDKLLKVI